MEPTYKETDSPDRETGRHACHHVIGAVPMQVAGGRGGFDNLVHIDELRRIREYGGILFNFCPNCGARFDVIIENTD